MNKLVIIGNGFDLAHGLPTSYSHLMNFFFGNHYLKITKNQKLQILFI
jgi:hypothetical protein